MNNCRLSDDEFQDVLQSLQGKDAIRDRLIFLLEVKSGFQASDLLSIRIGDVYRSGNLLTRVSVVDRSIRIHPSCMEALVEWIEELEVQGKADPRNPLFLTQNSKELGLNRWSA